jgi:hypothetical protein
MPYNAPGDAPDHELPLTERFEFAFDPKYRRPAGVFGVTPANAWVQVGESDLEARFGRWRVRSPLANVAGVAVTGPYQFFKTAGPARLGVTDRGLTFATNGERGVLISFRDKVRGIDRFGLIQHPELTVTVAEVERLAALLRGRTGT